MISASSGKEGIAIAEPEKPDAILLDAMMPDIDGIQTIAKLRENPKTKDIPKANQSQILVHTFSDGSN